MERKILGLGLKQNCNFLLHELMNYVTETIELGERCFCGDQAHELSQTVYSDVYLRWLSCQVIAPVSQLLRYAKSKHTFPVLQRRVELSRLNWACTAYFDSLTWSLRSQLARYQSEGAPKGRTQSLVPDLVVETVRVVGYLHSVRRYAFRSGVEESSKLFSLTLSRKRRHRLHRLHCGSSKRNTYGHSRR